MDFSQRQLGLVAAFAIIAGAVAFAPQSPLSVVSGQTIEYDSNGELFDGEVLSIIYNGRTSADDIQATFTESEIGSATGQEVEQDVDISVDDISSQAEYDLQDTGQVPLQEVRIISDAFRADKFRDADKKAKFVAKGNGLDLDGDGEVTVEMPEESSNYFEAAVFSYEGDALGPFDRHKSYVFHYEGTQDIGDVADIFSPNTEVSAEWTVEVEGGGAQSATVSNSDIGEGQNTRLSDHVIVRWLGNLDTGESAPQAGTRWRFMMMTMTGG